jgi:undecaprenyl-diphosphatase
MVNAFDSSIVHAIDSLAGKWPEIDRTMEFIVGNDLTQGALAGCIFWWLWFRAGSDPIVRRTREHLICTLVGSVVAISAGRALALSLPFRIRPRFEASLNFVIPSEPDPNVFMNWSSFPSDHAILYAALAAGFGCISLRLGILVFIYFLLVGAAPLMFLGYHYPTDIIVGSAIGILVGCAINLAAVRQRLSAPAFKWQRASQGSFYAALFLATFQIATTFVSLRAVALALVHYLKRAL